MDSLFLWIILGAMVYMLFSRKGGMGMGCCGHHDHHPNGPAHEDPKTHDSSSAEPEGKIIELKKEDYKVISSHDHQAHNETF